MKNSQQEVEGYGKPDRVQQSKAFTSLHLSPTCTKGDAGRKVTTMMKQREAYVERLKQNRDAGIPIRREDGCRRLEGL